MDNQLNKSLGNQYAAPHSYAGASRARMSPAQLRQQALEAFYRHREESLHTPGAAQNPNGGGIWDYLSQLTIHPANLLNYVTDKISKATR